MRATIRLAGLLALLALAAAVSFAGAANAAKRQSLGMTATPVDFAHVSIHWNTVAGAATYSVLRDQLVIAHTAGTTFTDSELWPQTSYAYTVQALSATGTVLSSGAATATTAPLPAGGFPRPFAPSSVWNTPVGNTPPVGSSAALIGYFAAHAVHPNMTLHDWGVSIAEAQPGDATFTVPCLLYSNCTLDVFGTLPIPLTAAPDPSSDGHLAVYDPAAGREWDLWQARTKDGAWTASAGSAVSTDGDGVAPATAASGDAANLPLLGGLVRPEEILQGHIDHALVFTMPGVSSLGHVCPATHNDGSTSDSNALEEGMRLQLDPSLNVDSLSIPSWEKTLARAMQTYGMYLRDEGGSLAIFAEDPISRGYDAWAKVGLTGDSVGITGIPWSDFRVVAAPC